MKAAVYHRFGGPDVVRVEQVPQPEVGATEVLIRVRATTVSAADRRARSKDVPAGLALPSSLVLGIRRPRRPILGMDVAGVVESVGARVTRFRPGDEVVAMLGSRFAGHAEFAVADESSAIALKPTTASFAEAVALVFGGITARAFLNQTRVEPGSSVLVNGASGAVGSAAVQLCAAAGAQVTAVSSAGNAELVRSLGADSTVDYNAADFAGGPDRYDIVIDCVGNAPVSRVRPVLRPCGAVLLVAGNLRSLVTAPAQARRHGLTVATAPGPYLASDLEHLGCLLDAGRLRAVIDRRYPLDEIAAAHRRVDTNRKRGNVVIDVG
ncbi:NAD(P)-dependent alcohol dehydrogenase [Microterricola viridarii]|uniref:NADPH:quinone reductase n=1 Tax=Microterricola viridarii TaxID=412690 RepID=A0A1H1UZ02_9MICO|nr:NAD(P)-dependent alcohol dehydrogenase [Microterricola viridarii]SDS77685.1 NADPH:quinone reductase [Microterricola viridarii]